MPTNKNTTVLLNTAKDHTFAVLCGTVVLCHCAVLSGLSGGLLRSRAAARSFAPCLFIFSDLSANASALNSWL